MECRLLFVYGSLRRGFELHPHLESLGARFLTEARVAAELMERGAYVGARSTGRAGKWVRGEIFQLPHPAQDLRLLDEVEGFTPGAPQGNEFVRALVSVVLGGGARRSAWIYWLGARTRSTRRIVSGDYKAWMARQSTGGAYG